MKVIAHRGASGHEPENTLAAIQAALDMKSEAIEIDVHLADGELLIIHDRWLHETTSGQGRVDEKSFEKLRQLDAGKGQKIPILEEVLQLVAGQCDLNIELKSETTIEPVIKMLKQAINELGFKKSQFLLSSFNHHLLNQINLLNENWLIGALTASIPLGYAHFCEALNAYSIHADIDFINQEFIDDAHNRKLNFFVYTVNEPSDISDLFYRQVDGIFTNYPARSKLLIDELESNSFKG